MSNPNTGIDENKKMILFARNNLIIYAVLIYIIAFLVNLEGLKEASLNTLSNTLLNIASTLLAIGIINIFYQQWQDRKLSGTIKSTILSVRQDIKDSIGETASEVSSNFNPAFPFKIYRQSETAGNELKEDLVSSLNESNTLLYTGVTISVAAASIKDAYKNCEKKQISMQFVIPHPMYNNLSNSDRETMTQNIKEIINCCRDQEQTSFTINFIFLNYIPAFHIHLTDHRCWFAFVDKGAVFHGKKNEEYVRKKYPTTYAYKHDGNKDNDITEMYATIHNIITELLIRHQDSKVNVIVSEGNPIKCNLGKLKKDSYIKNIFSDYTNSNEQKT